MTIRLNLPNDGSLEPDINFISSIEVHLFFFVEYKYMHNTLFPHSTMCDIGPLPKWFPCNITCSGDRDHWPSWSKFTCQRTGYI